MLKLTQQEAAPERSLVSATAVFAVTSRRRRCLQPDVEPLPSEALASSVTFKERLSRCILAFCAT